MTDSNKQCTPEERLTRAIKLIVALWFGGVVLFGGIGILLTFAESMGKQTYLLLALVLLPLSILTVRLVAHLLGVCPIKSSYFFSTLTQRSWMLLPCITYTCLKDNLHISNQSRSDSAPLARIPMH